MAQSGARRKELALILSDRSNVHKWASESTWTEGCVWDGWIHIIQRWAASDEPEKRVTGTQLHNVADAFRWHVEQELPWPRATWRQYQQRSRRWHDNRVRQARERHKQEIAQAVWTSEVTELKIGNTTATAITSATRLAEMGAAMRNCLDSYWRRCLGGTSRIFVLSRGGKTEAAGELHLYMDRWEIGQVEGMRMRRPPAWARRVMETVRDEYRQRYEEKDNRAIG